MLQIAVKLAFLENIAHSFQQKYTYWFFMYFKTPYVLFISHTVASMCAYSGLCVYLLQYEFHTCVLIWACASIRNSKGTSLASVVSAILAPGTGWCSIVASAKALLEAAKASAQVFVQISFFFGWRFPKLESGFHFFGRGFLASTIALYNGLRTWAAFGTNLW